MREKQQQHKQQPGSKPPDGIIHAVTEKMHTTKMTSSIGMSTVAALNLLGLHSFPQYGQRVQLYCAIASQ
jgi:hypothetical protein